MDVSTLASPWFAVALAAIAIVALAVLLRDRSPFTWARARLSQMRRPPVETPLGFTFVEDQSWCGESEVDGAPATQVHGTWQVRNKTRRDLRLVSAQLAGHETPHAVVFTREPHPTPGAQPTSGSEYSIPALRGSEVTATFFFVPPITRANGTIIADVIFIDEHSREHRVYGVRFRPLRTAG